MVDAVGQLHNDLHIQNNAIVQPDVRFKANEKSDSKIRGVTILWFIFLCFIYNLGRSWHYRGFWKHRRPATDLDLELKSTSLNGPKVDRMRGRGTV